MRGLLSALHLYTLSLMDGLEGIGTAPDIVCGPPVRHVASDTEVLEVSSAAKDVEREVLRITHKLRREKLRADFCPCGRTPSPAG